MTPEVWVDVPDDAPSYRDSYEWVVTAFCGGDGGTIYQYEGPQFGLQWVEEPCERCHEWHPDQRDWPAGDYYRPAGPYIGWLRRRRLTRGKG